MAQPKPVGPVEVMNNAEFQLRGLSDPRLAVYATSSLPAWLWSIDGTRIWWANPVGAELFDARNGLGLATKTFGPANPHRRQVMQLAPRLPPTGAVRLERLRGFGAALGGLLTCACSRLDFSDGGAGILVAATTPGREVMPLIERLRRLVEGLDVPIAAFAPDGMLVRASDAAHALPGFRNLSDADLKAARGEALRQGRAETEIAIGTLVLQRLGSGADIGLVALIEPKQPDVPAGGPVAEAPPAPDAATDAPIAHHEAAATPGAAFAGFDLIDEFAEPAETTPPRFDGHAHEPSPFIKTVADAPPATGAIAMPNSTAMPPWSGEPPQPRHNPLRFVWQMDADGRFSLGSDEFTRLIGARTAAALGRLWSEIAEELALDPQGLVDQAVATRDTWSGVTLNWPVDGGARLPVDLSGLPIYDPERNFIGYRGFGVCRDLDGLAWLARLRHAEFGNVPPGSQQLRSPAPRSLSADIARNAGVMAEPDHKRRPGPEPIVGETSHSLEPDTSVEPPKNVLPFRPVNEARSPALTPVENNAFNELARQLATRLEAESGALTREADPTPAADSTRTDSTASGPAASETPDAGLEPISATDRARDGEQPPEWLSPAEPPAQGEMQRDKLLFDLLPVGVLIYRLDRLLYANRAFLERIGYASLQALEAADGLDALFVEPVGPQGSSTSDTGTAVTIAATPATAGHDPLPPTEARLFTISWDGEAALALICSNSRPEPAAAPAAAVADPVAEPSPVGEAASPVEQATSPVGQANAEELGAILDTMADGVVMFDAQGGINSCNRSAEALFGYDGEDFTGRNLTELFAPESQRALQDYLESIRNPGVLSLLDQGRDVMGRVRGGGLIPLSMTMGRTRSDGPNFFAVFRDLSQLKKSETELSQARRQADRSATAKADLLARISHEVRTPLNAIIGFAEVMIGERFGTLGNERYVEYMKDIRASGERVMAIISDLQDLSQIETGKIDLAFTSQNLNELVESCVAVMQPQANRERIIVRTSLAQTLPAVVADGRALRQITLNLIGNSIHLANAGGQVIVSTALSDFGDVVLRVRDTGHGLNDNELAAAMEPFRTQGPADKTSENTGISLSLTKALVEANRAQFQIKTAPHSGTLIEVVFARAAARG
jgi:PAS domain S-box-containing protein